MKILILMNGRSVSGIYNDVVKQQQVSLLPLFDKVIVITFSGDQLGFPQLPVAFDLVSVKNISGTIRKLGTADQITLIANGGTTRQLVPTLAAIVSGWKSFKGQYQILDLQQDHIMLLEQRLESPEKPASEFSEEEAYSLYHHTSW